MNGSSVAYKMKQWHVWQSRVLNFALIIGSLLQFKPKWAVVFSVIYLHIVLTSPSPPPPGSGNKSRPKLTHPAPQKDGGKSCWQKWRKRSELKLPMGCAFIWKQALLNFFKSVVHLPICTKRLIYLWSQGFHSAEYWVFKLNHQDLKYIFNNLIKIYVILF